MDDVESSDIEAPKAASWAEGCRRHEAIRRLIERHPKLLPRSGLEEVAWELGVSRATLYRLIKQYRMFGTVDVLQASALGRKAGTWGLPKETEKVIETTIRDIYLKPTRPTLKHLVDVVHARCTEQGIALPDRRTVRARVKAIDARVKGLRRGESKLIKATAAMPGEYLVSRPLEVVQIDHTEIDIIIVDEQTRQPLPTRPWLTVAIDVFSRVVTGFHVSMNAPSRISVGLCLLHSVFDKAAWLKEREIGQDWPIAGLPEAIHVDNATEFKSRAFVMGCENEGMKIIYRPPAQPHMGGHIERLIGTMMGAVHLLPGTTFSNPQERGDYDSAGAASMTLRDLENYLAVEITGSYHQRIHESLHRAPIAVWREFSASAPLRMPRDRIGFWVSFLPDEKRQLRPDGVHLFGLKYWHGALAQDIGRTSNKAVVRYDPRDISRVFVERPSGAFVEARWHDLTLPPISLHEWRSELKDRNKKAVDERDTPAMMRAIAKKRQIVEQANYSTLTARKRAGGRSRADKTDDDLGTLRGVDSRTPVQGED
jgi:putative transposase